MKSVARALILGLASAGASLAATIQAEFWDAPSSFANVQEAIDYAESNTATARFQSTMIDYPNGRRVISSRRTTLEEFIGATDAPTIVGNGQTNLQYSVFKFTGFLDLDAGIYEMTVGSDDGFRLIFTEGGVDRVVAERARPRGFRGTTEDVGVSGDTRFTLYYFENRGRTGVTFWIDGDVVDQTSLVPVPIPAGMPLLLAGLLGLGLLGRHARRSR